ncbi:uncharacterized protein EV422DRAFT_570407 [Fimicolochytrium jonesii]|uniref:uncharacterized protein n=1 Tax=Fimicolochytrium jonesii TaxID=1396493 RepID=UPI0022FDB710|nr:uncharacterized protein EV422DRAFT_570407 [Fimicolochytrium jonesii]KAI8817638.1 hypothetical protein EV422DRAFT_570407 [Fimicolochytrium jonesii]
MPNHPTPVQNGDLAVKTKPDVDAQALAQRLGLTYIGPIGELENQFIFRPNDTNAASEVQEQLQAQPEVENVSIQEAKRRLFKRS